MDLTSRALPDTVTVGGRAFHVHTDYRVWMRFEIERMKMREGKGLNVGYLFVDEKPKRCDIRDLLKFAHPVDVLPRSIGHSSGAIALDYEIDSDLIYSAILGQYGIDLIDVEHLHWHKFLALIKGLNNSTKLREIMGYRCYVKQRSKTDPYEELKYAWSIERTTEEEQEETEKFNSYFS